MFLSLEKNYLEWYFHLLTIFGMWNPYVRNETKKRLYGTYALFLFIVAGMAPSLGEIIHAWKNRKNIVSFSQHFTLVAAMSSTMAKVVNIWNRRNDLKLTADLLNWERRQPCNRKFALYRDEIIVATIRACQLFSWAFIVMVCWYCIFSYGKILIYSHGDLDKVSISPLLYRLNQESYWLMFIIDKMAISYLAGCTACHDIFFTVFLIHVSAQLDLLKRRLEFCQKNFLKDDFVSKDYEQHDVKVECVCRSISEELFLDPIIELDTCIRHHQNILRYADLIQNIFNNTLLLQFATSLLIIPMAGFQILGEQNVNKNELIDIANFLMCAFFQLFLYCWFGTEIISKSESVGLSAYSSKWYNADKRFKKRLHILLYHGQIPIVFRAGYICNLSSQTFVNIISKCYSSLAVLKQAQE